MISALGRGGGRAIKSSRSSSAASEFNTNLGHMKPCLKRKEKRHMGECTCFIQERKEKLNVQMKKKNEIIVKVKVFVIRKYKS